MTPVEPTAGDGPQTDPTPEEDAESRRPFNDDWPDAPEEPEGHSEGGEE